MSQYKEVARKAFEEREGIDEAVDQLIRFCGGVCSRRDLPAVPIVENEDGSFSTQSKRLFQR